MTQVNRTPATRAKLASPKHASGRTLAQRRADFEAQVRAHLTEQMALDASELPAVSERLKDLRHELARKRGVREVSQYAVAHEMGKAPRTFQSWENGEVEPRFGYGPMAEYYSRELEREITRNWIMFGQEEIPPVPSNGAGPLDELSPSAETDGDLREILARIADRQAELLSKMDAVLEEQERQRRLPPPDEQTPGGSGS